MIARSKARKQGSGVAEFFRSSRVQWACSGLVFLLGAVVLGRSLFGPTSAERSDPGQSMPLTRSVSGAWVALGPQPANRRAGPGSRGEFASRGPRRRASADHSGHREQGGDRRSETSPNSSQPFAGESEESPVRADPAPRRQPEPGKRPAKTVLREIEVEDGDSFWTIAERTLGRGVEWPRIAALNPDVDPERLREGMRLKVPVTAEGAVSQPVRKDPQKSRKHVVAPGESLSVIANRYRPGESWEWLYEANRDAIPNPEVVPTGTTLVIR
jgi:nucleoid-associated protein YgaU